MNSSSELCTSMESDTDAPMEAVAGVGDPGALMMVKKPRKNTCVVCGPTNEKVRKIPKNDPLREMWLQALELPRDVRKTARVCESHFADGESVPRLVIGDAPVGDAMDVEVNLPDNEVNAVATDVEVAKDVADAEDVDVEEEDGYALPPKKAWQLMAQVKDKDATIARLTARLAVKTDENTRLKQQLDIHKQMNDRKNDELTALRKKVHSLQTMLARKAKKDLGAGPSNC